MAEVTAPAGSTWEEQVATARDVRAFFASIPGLVDIDWWVPETPSSPRVTIDRDLAGSRGIAIQDAVRTLALALGRPSTTDVLEPGERNPTPLTLLLPLATRSRVGDLLALPLSFSDTGRPLRLGAVAQASSQPLHLPITRKDLERVVFVTADTAGISPADAVFALQAAEKAAPLPRGYAMNLSGEGEWKITIDVFRDLGLAFAAALAGIYILLVGQTGSLAVPLVMMVAIPITAIGIFPGFWLINAVSEGRVGSYANPTYFTATAMIGMIALAGIVVRNSVILVDFIEVLRKRGASVADAVLGAGAVRLRPIVLTAATSLLGIWVMALDPVFSGLAWSFIFGILASTSFTLVVVPLIYWLLNRSKDSLDA